MPSEKWLWGVVRNRKLGGHKFRRQVTFGPFIVDFACEEVKVIVELDGASHDSKLEYDGNRQLYLESLGFHVIRIGTLITVEDGHDIPTIIREACDARLKS